MNSNSLVWYACYGSNIATERFLCYIQGGTYPGNSKVYKGGRDKTAPRAEENYTLQHQLYFAKEAHIWGGGGVCFINNQANAQALTLAKIYLISPGQFEDLHAQECNKNQALSLDLKQAEQRGFIDAYPEKWYGRILFLGRHQGHPIFTFTNVNTLKDFKPPAPNYLQSLVHGLKSSYSITDLELVNYFADKPGITGNMNKAELQRVIAAAS